MSADEKTEKRDDGDTPFAKTPLRTPTAVGQKALSTPTSSSSRNASPSNRRTSSIGGISVAVSVPPLIIPTKPEFVCAASDLQNAEKGDMFDVQDQHSIWQFGEVVDVKSDMIKIRFRKYKEDGSDEWVDRDSSRFAWPRSHTSIHTHRRALLNTKGAQKVSTDFKKGNDVAEGPNEVVLLPQSLSKLEEEEQGHLADAHHAPVISANEPPSPSSVDFANITRIFDVGIEIERADNLVRADTFGKSDPYVVVEMAGLTWTTRIVKQELDPIWSEKFRLLCDKQPTVVKLTVYDWDKGKEPDFLGDAELELEPYFKANKTKAVQVALRDVKHGNVSLFVTARAIAPNQSRVRAAEQRVSEAESKAAKLMWDLERLQLNLSEKDKEINGLVSTNKALTEKLAAATSPNRKSRRKSTNAGEGGEGVGAGIAPPQGGATFAAKEGSINETQRLTDEGRVQRRESKEEMPTGSADHACCAKCGKCVIL